MNLPFVRRLGACLPLCAAAATLALGQAARPSWNVRDFGAKGDGAALDTAAVNRAIAECNRAGGGTVVFPAGTYRVGTVTMLSDVTLDLDAGSVLRGSGDMRDYPPLPFTSEDRNTTLLFANGAHDIAITGRGTIDGNGDAFAYPDQADKDRDFLASDTRQGDRYLDINDLPQDGPVRHRDRPGILLLFVSCQRVQVSDIHIVNAPNWNLHAACSRDIVLSRLEIASSMILPNSDGIDCSFCTNVRISDCNIAAGDDAIAFGPCAVGYGTQSTENIVVENCTLSSRSAAIRIGWGAHTGASDFRDMLFSNIVIRDSNRGIGIFVRAGESVENVEFSHIVIETRLFRGKWWGKADPIHLSAVRADGSQGAMGRIRNVSFDNIMIEGEAGVVVEGCADSAIEDVSFDHVSQKLKNGPLVRSFGGNFDLRPAVDPGLRIFRHDVPALYASHVRNLSVRNYTVDRDPALPDFVRDGVVVEEFEGLAVDGFSHRQLPPNGDSPGIAIRLRNGTGAAIRNCAGGLGDAKYVSAENVKP